jgi:putative membrane protein
MASLPDGGYLYDHSRPGATVAAARGHRYLYLRPIPTKIKGMRFSLGLLAVFLALWIALAVAPFDRRDWLLENLLTLVTLVLLVITARRHPLPRVSYVLVFAFLCLHIVGAHYTYSEVPYERWGQAALGLSLNGLLGWQRNNFDRVIHFAYGLLLAWPVRERLRYAGVAPGVWAYLQPVNLALSSSVLYELLEWGTANLVAGDLGMAYLGTQGDVWDAHKDMALAGLGAVLAMAITLAWNGSGTLIAHRRRTR